MAKAATTQTMTADAATTTSQSLSFNGFLPESESYRASNLSPLISDR